LGTNCNKMFKKDTLEKLSKKFTMNREIMGKVDISGRKKIELFKGGNRRI